MTEKYERLIKLLKELFQIDRPDLDFGIYQIMNQKREEITSFLDKDLLPQVQKAFAEYGAGGRGGIQAELDAAIEQAHKLEIDPDTSPAVKALREKLEGAVDVDELENEIYSHLFTFFRRYYKDGDFLSLRRYKKDVYAIPYEGEEVKLHWANADQYYIKSSEDFRDYSFKLGDVPATGEEDTRKRVHFKLVDADTEIANNKAQEGKERRFVLCEEAPMVEIDGELCIRFEYKPTDKKQAQKKLNEDAVVKILNDPEFVTWIPDLARETNGKSALEKHLTTYTAKNTSDYFIHKDLGGFLRRELDFYIKNEMVHLDDFPPESMSLDAATLGIYERTSKTMLAKISVLRRIAHKIICFLEQLENFQKKLWLKKKFVVQTDYCITLDRVPEELYPEICANEAQRKEWVELFAIDEIEKGLMKEGYSEPLTEEFLKQNPLLVLDTKNFTNSFTRKLLSTIEDVDKHCGGLSINSENFQALNLLQNRYKKQVSCVYIDPPYNTGKDGFPYKDRCKHSTWISMISDRIFQSLNFMHPHGAFFISIDEKEHHNLKYISDLAFGSSNMLADFIWLAEGNFDNQAKIKIAHEYILSYATKESDFSYPPVIDPSIAKDSKLFNNEIQNTIVKNGPKNPVSCIKIPRGFPVSFEKGMIKKSNTTWPHYNEDIIVENYRVKNVVIAESGWSSKSLCENFIKNGMKSINDSKGQLTSFVITNTGAIESIKKRSHQQSYVISTIKGVGTIQSTRSMLDNMNCSYPHYPKPPKLISYLASMTEGKDPLLVMDYFAGSGTTAQAVINMNREDDGTRKYILVEMGNYFDTVITPRIKKVIYSDSWKNGKPISRKGSSHMFKYMSLESYEDALNNLKFKRTDSQGKLLMQSPNVKEEYMLSYMMDLETDGSASLLNVDRFDDPWNYTMKIATGSAGETKVRPVDLVETFNYLLGLTVVHRDFIRDIEIIEGTNPEGEKVLVIWRNTTKTNNEQLDDFFRKQNFNSRDAEFDLIYVNGDNNLENLKRTDETWKVRLIEENFKRLMFDVEDV